MNHDRRLAETSPNMTIAVVDTETTGLDPTVDEIVGLSVLCVEVARSTGRQLGVVGSYSGWREPAVMSELAETIVGVRKAELQGERLDRHRAESLFRKCDLVVAHCAAVDRRFLETLLPILETLPWVCSLHEIDWFGAQHQSQASVDHLLSVYGLPLSDGTPESDCRALASILARPLPNGTMTGFRQLIDASLCVTVECQIDDAGEDAVDALLELGFLQVEDRWQAKCATAEEAEDLEVAVIDRAVGDAAFDHLRMRRVDAGDRFSIRSDSWT